MAKTITSNSRLSHSTFHPARPDTSVLAAPVVVSGRAFIGYSPFYIFSCRHFMSFHVVFLSLGVENHSVNVCPPELPLSRQAAHFPDFHPSYLSLEPSPEPHACRSFTTILPIDSPPPWELALTSQRKEMEQSRRV